MSNNTTTTTELPTTLAAFKRWLGSGGVLTLQSYHYVKNGAMTGPWNHRGLGMRRKAHGETNGTILVLVEVGNPDPQEVRLDYGPARDWTFRGDIATMDDGATRLTYEMSTA